MSTQRGAGGHRLVSRAAIVGLIAGITALAAGIILTTTSGPTASDDSPSVTATLALLLCGPTLAMASAAVGRRGTAVAGRHPPRTQAPATTRPSLAEERHHLSRVPGGKPFWWGCERAAGLALAGGAPVIRGAGQAE